MFLFKKPSLFISYSRQDESLAAFLYDALSAKGYRVFYDREGILVGENFAEKIQQSVKNTDAFIFIISDNSIQSKWCKAEVYTSIAMNKRLVPIRYKNSTLDVLENYVLFPKNLNYVDVNTENDYQNAVDKIHKMLFSTRRENVLKKIKIVFFIALIIVFGYIALNELPKKINTWYAEKKKVEVTNQVKSASKIFNGEQIENMVQEFIGDVSFTTQMHQLSSNKANNDYVRVNALLIANFLERLNKPNERWYINNITISDNTIKNASFSAITLMDSSIANNVVFLNSNFSNVLWASSISNSKYKSCYFLANRVCPKSMVGVDYENCIFRGGEISLENLGAVHFYLKSSDSSSSVITNELALFENCVLKNCTEPPNPNVVEILYPDSEVRFTSVLFEGCHFRGFIRSSWFKNCIFSNCVFPKEFNLKELDSLENILQNVLRSDEPCY